MAVRRRNAPKKPRQYGKPPAKSPEIPRETEFQVSEPEEQYPRAEAKCKTVNSLPAGNLPVAVVLEILAGQYQDSIQGEALCWAALKITEESGVLEKYRARWDEEETNLSGHQSIALFDRRQALELIQYHKGKGNQPSLQRETERLSQLEGRLLLGTASPARITEEDLEEMERYIKEEM